MHQELQEKLDKIKHLDAQNEKIAIGHMLQDEQSAIMASRMLQEKYFITPYAAHIFKIVRSCVEEGKLVSDIYFKVQSITEEGWASIAPKLKILKKEYLTECISNAVAFIGTAIIAEGIFNKIQKQYFRRETFFLYENVKPKILDTVDNKNLEDVVYDLGQQCNILLDGMVASEEHDYKTAIMNVLHAKEQNVISTGYEALDNILDGFKPGQLITIGAGTGVGKSAFAVNLTLNVADQGYKVGLWSFKMDKEGVYQRIISVQTGISKKDKFLKEERYNATRKYLKKTNHDIQVFTDRIKDLGSFYLQCRRSSIRENMKVVIIDYVQLMHLSGFSGGNRVAEIEMITKTLKNMASELGITIIILSQLSREHKKRENKTPMLSDLRDSGSIEQDSNVVIFLHKPNEQPSHLDKSEKIIKVIVAKNRDGSSGVFALKYQGNITKFIESN